MLICRTAWNYNCCSGREVRADKLLCEALKGTGTAWFEKRDRDRIRWNASRKLWQTFSATGSRFQSLWGGWSTIYTGARPVSLARSSRWAGDYSFEVCDRAGNPRSSSKESVLGQIWSHVEDKVRADNWKLSFICGMLRSGAVFCGMRYDRDEADQNSFVRREVFSREG